MPILCQKFLWKYSLIGSAFCFLAGCATQSPSALSTIALQTKDCPFVYVMDGTQTHFILSNKQQLNYQPTLSTVRLQCRRIKKQLIFRAEVSGRIIPGESFQTSIVHLPIRVAVRYGDSLLYSQLFLSAVGVNDPIAATQFLDLLPSIRLPFTQAQDIRELQIIVGFDYTAMTNLKT